MRRATLLGISALATSTLLGCGGPGVPRKSPATMSYAPANAQTDPIPREMTRLELHAPEEDKEATLRSHDGKVLCELPCTADVPDGSKFYVDVPVTEKKSKRVELPDSIEGASKGSSAAFTAMPRKGSPRGALGVTLGGAVFVFVGVLLISGNCGPAPPNTTPSEAVSRSGACTGGFVSIVLGALVAAGGAGWMIYSSSAHLEPRSPSAPTPAPAPTPVGRLIPGGFAF